MEDKIKQVSSFNFTDSQLQVIDAVLKWIMNKDTYEPITISGAAGTGKTTILKEIRKYSPISNIVLTAPTHKAVRVIKDNVPNTKSSTIQRLLGLRPNVNIENFDVNNPAFSVLGKIYLVDYDFVIIDEASMINASLYNTINDLANQYSIKILYVGDKYQLPPINENISLAFINNKQYELTEIVRQEKGNPLLELLGYARDDVIHRKNIFLTYVYSRANKVNDKKEGFYIFNSTDKQNTITFQSQLAKAMILAKETNNYNLVKYAAYTNNNIKEWNEHIRNRLIQSSDMLVKGDILTGYNTIVDQTFNSPIITNSEDYVIIDCIKFVHEKGFKGYEVKLKNTYTGVETPYMFILDHTDTNSVNMFIKIAINLIDNALSRPANQRSSAWRDFYKFKDSVLLLTTFKYKNGKPIVSKDIDYGYALTIHKTQGSTYGNIFINLLDILYQNGSIKNNIDIRNKLIYVALSRASKIGFILI